MSDKEPELTEHMVEHLRKHDMFFTGRVTRAEPSRLEIAAMLMSACLSANIVCEESGVSKFLKWADLLIKAAKEET